MSCFGWRPNRLLTAWVLTGIAIGCTPPEPPPPRPAVAKRTAVAPVTVEDPQAAQALRQDGLTGGKLVFEDHFDRAEPGTDWLVKHAGEWTLEDGWLRAHKVANEDERNAGVWLQKPLPDKVRITFRAKSTSAVGDLKCEVFAEQPKHESGYSVIFGGWGNTINTITRRGEHEADRVIPSAACFVTIVTFSKPRPVRAPGLQNQACRRKPCRPRALTRRWEKNCFSRAWYSSDISQVL